MTKLTKEQSERVARIRQSRRDLIDELEDLYERGEVESEPAGFFNRLAGYYQSVGVFATYQNDFDAAQKAFANAAAQYQRSAEEDIFPLHSTRQRMRGMYTALLAGRTAELVDIAESMITLAESNDCSPGDQHDDRFFFAWCLAGAVLDVVDETALSGLKAVNESKPGAHADYGQAVISVAQGIHDGELPLLRSGINSMLSFHEKDMSSDNVSDLIMSVPATALQVLVRAKGYDVTVPSPFVPTDLVTQALDDLEL